MNINKKNLIRYIIVGICILVIFGLAIMLLSNNKKEGKKIDLNKVSDNYTVDDIYVMSLYKRYNPERDLLFYLIGSNNNKDYYGYFYKNKNLMYDDLDDVVKNTILFNEADYKTGVYNKNNNCYYMSLDSYAIIYKKFFGDDDYNINYEENYLFNIDINKDNICIGEFNLINDSNSAVDLETNDNSSIVSNEKGVDYNKVIDTYMVNAINEDDYIVIYERVAFIKIGKEYLSFYKDYKMKDLVYKLKITDKLDMGFVNNEEVVSNVLLKYQDEFDLYEYKYKKGVDSYYFESIER